MNSSGSGNDGIVNRSGSGGGNNPAPPPRTSVPTYHQKALEEIHISLLPFAKNNCEATAAPVALTPSSGDVIILRQMLGQLLNLGYGEEMALKAVQQSGGRVEVALDWLLKQTAGGTGLSSGGGGGDKVKLIRKPSIERELGLYHPHPHYPHHPPHPPPPHHYSHPHSHHRGHSPLDSGAGSSRSDSPRLPPSTTPSVMGGGGGNSGSEPPPPPPPRNTPPPPPPNVQQLFKRMSPVAVGGQPPIVPARSPAVPLTARGTSPVSSSSANSSAAPVSGGNRPQPMVVQNGPQAQQQLTQQMQALSLLGGGGAGGEPPPPYPLIATPPPPPSYTASIMQNRQPSPTATTSITTSTTPNQCKSPSSGIYSAASSAASSPLHWNNRPHHHPPHHHHPIIMQSVKSTQVQKPVLQTAVAPTTPQPPPPPPPSYTASIQQKQKPPTTEPPSYTSTMQAKAQAAAAAAGKRGGGGTSPLPPPRYSEETSTVESGVSPRPSALIAHAPLQRQYSDTPTNDAQLQQRLAAPLPSPPAYPDTASAVAPPLPPTASSSVKSNSNNNSLPNGNVELQPAPPPKKIKHQSPIPERKKISKEKEEERRDGKVKNYSPQAFKFFMEQHIENVLKSYKQRLFRRMQLETEMCKIGLSAEAQQEMRKMLSQKESNYIRLKRAKMDKTMFHKIKPIGLGAFGEVTLVRKIDTNHLYAMKTLRKADVLKRNQVAHVKAERDILAEADNEWVVKLYYSFQDSDLLYFVMDYIPGGDLMSLLIKLGVFEESLARFYIAELTCAVESVHKMGFIHRDIKPDNILIDRDGHIKLTDFGLCTGFRWTHNSKYYQPANGDHNRQDSMDQENWLNAGDASANNNEGEECRCKLLERRRRMENQRCLAHSLVGTPNYIAPEVLQRIGYTQLCDWWSVGVILYEMLVGSPPFLANTPAETQYKVINWETTLSIPAEANLTPASADLILSMCSDPQRRLGRNGAAEIKGHRFFAGIDWSSGSMLRRQPAPYVPLISYPTDTSNFDPPIAANQSSSEHQLTTGSSSSEGLLAPFHGFLEFTFRRFFDDVGGQSQQQQTQTGRDDGGGANGEQADVQHHNQGPVYV